MNRGYVNRYVRRRVDELGGMTYHNPPRGHAYWRCGLTNHTLSDVGTPRSVNHFYNTWNQDYRRLQRARGGLTHIESLQNR